MQHFTTSRPKSTTHAVITRADGRTYNLGRVDNKWWAPRAWFYRFVIFPADKRKRGDR